METTVSRGIEMTWICLVDGVTRHSCTTSLRCPVTTEPTTRTPGSTLPDPGVRADDEDGEGRAALRRHLVADVDLVDLVVAVPAGRRTRRRRRPGHEHDRAHSATTTFCRTLHACGAAAAPHLAAPATCGRPMRVDPGAECPTGRTRWPPLGGCAGRICSPSAGQPLLVRDACRGVLGERSDPSPGGRPFAMEKNGTKHRCAGGGRRTRRSPRAGRPLSVCPGSRRIPSARAAAPALHRPWQRCGRRPARAPGPPRAAPGSG